MTVLITGASGFVGSAVLRRLLAEGAAVRALVRPASDRRNLDGLDVEVVTGDLGDRDSLARAVRGCEALFHVAADYRLWTRDADAMMRTNIGGSRDIVRAATEAGVARIVYTSSVATLGHELGLLVGADHVGKRHLGVLVRGAALGVQPKGGDG